MLDAVIVLGLLSALILGPELRTHPLPQFVSLSSLPPPPSAWRTPTPPPQDQLVLHSIIIITIIVIIINLAK